MDVIGTHSNWLFFSRAGRAVAVNLGTFDTTDALPEDQSATLVAAAESADDAGWARPGDDDFDIQPGQLDLARLLAQEMFAQAVDPHPHAVSASAQQQAHAIPDDVKAEIRRGLTWHRTFSRGATSLALANAHALAESEHAEISTLRALSHYFPTRASAQSAKGWNPGDDGFPSPARIGWALHGGDAARQWATAVVSRSDLAAIIAAAYDPDAGMEEADDADPAFADGSLPHRYAPAPDFPQVCRYCPNSEADEIHDVAAVDYSQIDTDPATSHYFSESPADETACEICGNDPDHQLHREAALAQYYLNKPVYDQMYAETTQYWDAKKAEGATPVTAGVGGDWVDDEDCPDGDCIEAMFDQYAETEQEVESLFWPRNGNEDEDPLEYFVAFDPADELSANALHAYDGTDYYRLDDVMRTWLKEPLPSAEQFYPVDDETAYGVIRGVCHGGGFPVDMREIDPGEAYLMETCVPAVDAEMLDREIVLAAGDTLYYGPAKRPAGGGDRMYTPEERRDNAKRQVRDSRGWFVPQGGGKVKKPRKRRAKASVKNLTPLTKEELLKVIENFMKYVERMRAKLEASPLLASAITDPAQSDVPPVYMALIDETNNDAVLELMALVPADTTTNTPTLLRRVAGGKWEPDLNLLRDLQGVTPPAVAALDDAKYKDVLAQVDQFYIDNPGGDTDEAEPAPDPVAASSFTVPVIYGENGEILAAGIPGIADTPSDWAAVEKLKRYWTVGEGGLKIRWGTPGDWTRCHRHLQKYMGPRSKGYCANLHHTMNGYWPGDHRNHAVGDGELDPGTALTPEEIEAMQRAIEDGTALIGDIDNDEELLTAIYGEYGEIIAAGIPGIADTPSDAVAVARLKRYWTVGAGGLKIRWGTPGDWTRCYRHLRKYMGPRAKGYCANLHHAMNGYWPGDRKNRRGFSATSTDPIALRSTDEIIALSAALALTASAEYGDEGEMTGARFRIPVLAPVGVKSGDGREFSPVALSTRDLPIPLMWQIQTQDGHNASVIVGRIDSIESFENGGLGNARGVFDTGPYGAEAERLVRNRFLRGVSVDLDNFEATSHQKAPEMSDEDFDGENTDTRQVISQGNMVITNGRVIAATLVAKPAFQECTIEIDDSAEELDMLEDGNYIGTPATEEETQAMIASALTAAGIPVNPPSAWFENPGLGAPTPLTVDPEGRVFGHIATWDTDHIGLPFSTRPPKSHSGYAYFHTGLLRTAEGTDIPVGQLTLAGGHASLSANAAAAVKHYDDTASAICDVHAGEDAFGIWVAGGLRPSATPEQVRAMRASSPSGDWRPINGRLELVAVCQVNVPGFPVPRARVASGHIYSLVAAGTATLNMLRSESSQASLSTLANRVESLEAVQRTALEDARNSALHRFSELRGPDPLTESASAARDRFLSLRDQASAEFRDYSEETRKEYADKGWALPDGSYPIRDVGDLRNAIMAFGRAKDKASAKRHIRKRAKALGRADLIPESFVATTEELALEIEEIRAHFALSQQMTAGGFYPDGTPWDPKRHPRGEGGKFRRVIAKIKTDLEGQAGTSGAVDALDRADQAAERGDIDAANKAAEDAMEIVDDIANDTNAPDTKKELRDGYEALGEAVANMPIAFGDLNDKFKYSELPEDLQSLFDQLLDRVKARMSGPDLDKAINETVSFMSGGDVLSQPEISAQLTKLLRYII